MKYLFFISAVLVSSNVFSWTLSTSSRSGFGVSKINVYVSSNACTNASLTVAEVESLTKEAIDDYWNGVSTSSLELSLVGVSSINTSSDDLNAAVAKVGTNSIIVGCSQNATLFASASNVGVGGISCSGGGCRAAVLLNDTAGTNLGSSSRDRVVMTLAHELGHAIGIGHSSVEEALMYFSLTGKDQKSLHQDDIDALTYLYPNEKKLAGLAGACGTIRDINKNSNDKNSDFNFMLSLCIAFFISYMLSRFLKRPAKLITTIRT